jgi:hypothetical protein
MWRKAAVWGTAGLALAGCVLVITVPSRPESVPQAALLQDAVGSEDWKRGAGEAEIQLVEYGDYQCPPCARYHLLIEQAMSEYGTRIAFVYRHFPLREIHPHAELAALAAEAERRQGKHGGMHSLLYRRQKEWAGTADARPVFESYARLLGLDLTRFAADLKDPALLGEVERLPEQIACASERHADALPAREEGPVRLQLPGAAGLARGGGRCQRLRVLSAS